MKFIDNIKRKIELVVAIVVIWAEVLLFGSVARDDTGRDLDLAVIVNQARFDDYVADIRQNPDVKYTRHAVRCASASRAIGWHHLRLARIFPGHIPLLDVVLLPPNWKQRLYRLPDLLNYQDPLFFQNLAADARVFDPKTHTFSPLRVDPHRELRVAQIKRTGPSY